MSYARNDVRAEASTRSNSNVPRRRQEERRPDLCYPFASKGAACKGQVRPPFSHLVLCAAPESAGSNVRSTRLPCGASRTTSRTNSAAISGSASNTAASACVNWVSDELLRRPRMSACSRASPAHVSAPTGAPRRLRRDRSPHHRSDPWGSDPRRRPARRPSHPAGVGADLCVRESQSLSRVHPRNRS
jgi:hypothetical protein